jgi:hypothetical protein
VGVVVVVVIELENMDTEDEGHVADALRCGTVWLFSVIWMAVMST